jgi:hypothetical protein
VKPAVWGAIPTPNTNSDAFGRQQHVSDRQCGCTHAHTRNIIINTPTATHSGRQHECTAGAHNTHTHNTTHTATHSAAAHVSALHVTHAHTHTIHTHTKQSDAFVQAAACEWALAVWVHTHTHHARAHTHTQSTQCIRHRQHWRHRVHTHTHTHTHTQHQSTAVHFRQVV